MKNSMNKGEQTKARLIEKTAELIAAQGYHATGLNQITLESSTPIGSLYYHFRGGKDALVIAAMQAGGALITNVLNEAFSSASDPVTAIRAVISLLGDQLENSGYMLGCPIATVTLESAATNDTIQAASQAIYHEWQTRITQFFIQTGYVEPFSSSLAMFALAAIEGGLLLSRAERSIVPLQQVGEQLIRFIRLNQQKDESDV